MKLFFLQLSLATYTRQVDSFKLCC